MFKKYADTIFADVDDRTVADEFSNEKKVMERKIIENALQLMQTVFRNQDILECLIRKSPSISTSQNVLDGPIKAIFFLLVSPVRPQVKGEAMRTLAVFAKHKPSTSRFIWTMLTILIFSICLL